jgi:hypothetical protein
MRVRWNKIVIWLFLEILFNFLGVDELVDYSEFLLQSSFVAGVSWVQISFTEL